MNHKNIKRRIIVHMALFICIAVIIEVSILSFANRRQAGRTSQILLDQVENILINNEKSEQDTIESLKAEYIERANTVAYILENNDGAKTDIAELERIAVMMGIDEINLFDSDGVIFGGTYPGYYGISFDSGEQVSFFKPMLNDKSMALCQDVTPNTAEAKSMMYALVWNRPGTYMVQVGIEPVRLLEEVRANSILEVVRQIPTYDGVSVYVADISSGEILGATDYTSIGKTLCETGMLDQEDDLRTIQNKSVNIEHFRNYCSFRQCGEHIIAVVYSTKANVGGFAIALAIEIVWLLIAGTVIVYALLKLANANKKIHDQVTILSSISDIYYSMHLIDLNDFSVERFEANELMDEVVSEGQNAADMLRRLVDTAIEDEYVDAALQFVDITTLGERLKNKNSISMDVVDKNVGWLRMSFIRVEADDDMRPTKVIVATQVIDDDKRREEELIYKANRDELTGLLNRRAYEDDILCFPDVPPEQDFVYAAIDINGLKVTNDDLGHAAGDELIRGTAICLMRTFGNYGRIYRTGGDEFVSIFFADEEHVKDVLKDLEQVTATWSGQYIDSISVSVGYVTKREFPTDTVVDMAKIADERMYQAKTQYYAQKGIDRRGQAAAHTALCNLYTKILKINLTSDNFTVVNMDISEQAKDKGFSNSISEWLGSFGKLGYVHEEDLAEYLEKTDIAYLRDYFRGDKTSISIHYRRKYEDGFKQVVMEIIPADDYSHENQSLFLYVKMVDR